MAAPFLGMERQMKRYLVVLCLLLLAAVTSIAHAAKPGSPIAVEIVQASAIKSGHEARFKVTAVSQVPAEEMQITIHPVGGVKWSKGDKHWKGPAQQGMPVVMEFSVIVPKQGDFELHATASVRGKRGGGFGARAVYHYEVPAARKAEPKERKTLRNGQEIIEVPLR